MDHMEMLEGLKEAQALIAEHVPVILGWTALKALDEAIRQMSGEQAEVA